MQRGDAVLSGSPGDGASQAATLVGRLVGPLHNRCRGREAWCARCLQAATAAAPDCLRRSHWWSACCAAVLRACAGALLMLLSVAHCRGRLVPCDPRPITIGQLLLARNEIFHDASREKPGVHKNIRPPSRDCVLEVATTWTVLSRSVRHTGAGSHDNTFAPAYL